MIQDKTIRVTYRNNDGTTAHVDLTISGQQMADTCRRRMNSLMPNAKVIDMTDANGDQGDLTVRTPKRT